MSSLTDRRCHYPRPQPGPRPSWCSRFLEFPVDWSRIVTAMITIKGIYGREIFETWYAVSVLLEDGAPGVVDAVDARLLSTRGAPDSTCCQAHRAVVGWMCSRVRQRGR